MTVEAEQDQGGGIPEWVVTFGDMMSLLLTFFIMLVSLSEIKEDEKYQALVESIQQRFGYDLSQLSLVPGTARPRNAQLARLATAGRARRLDIHSGGDKTRAPSGDFPRVRIIRPGHATTVGTVLFFRDGQTGVDQAHRRDLAVLVDQMKGKPQKIEVRGHARRHAPGEGSDPWEEAYQRCRAVRDALLELGIPAERIRISVAGPYEPLSTEPEHQHWNARVEVFMLEELVTDLEGSGQKPQALPAPLPDVPPPEENRQP